MERSTPTWAAVAPFAFHLGGVRFHRKKYPAERAVASSGNAIGRDLGEVALQYPAGTWLGRGERLAMAIIRDSIGERPIHFASTAGLATTLGMDRWVVRQGLTARLRIEDLEEAEGVVRTGASLGGEYVDLDLSLRLAEEIFEYRGLDERDVWSDRSSLSIPWQFYFLYLQLADAAIRDGRPPEFSDHLVDRADEFMVTAQGGRRGIP